MGNFVTEKVSNLKAKAEARRVEAIKKEIEKSEELMELRAEKGDEAVEKATRKVVRRDRIKKIAIGTGIVVGSILTGGAIYAAKKNKPEDDSGEFLDGVDDDNLYLTDEFDAGEAEGYVVEDSDIEEVSDIEEDLNV